MLDLTVDLLTGTYDATGPGGRAEWPPHPARLFAALVAAAGPGRTSAEEAVLRSLEQLAPPHVQASSATVESEPTRMVPVADAVNALEPARAEQRRQRAWPAVPQVQFVWPDAPADARLLAGLDGLARRVGYLGRATSAVLVRATSHGKRVEPTPEGAGLVTWVPATGGIDSQRLRVPFPGLLDSLDAHYHDPALVVPEHPIGYGLATSRAAEAAAVPGPFAAPMVLRRVGGPRVPAELALRATATLRAATLDLLKQDCPAVLSGHGPSNELHAAYLAMPDVGHRYADGHLLGVAIALPRGEQPALVHTALARHPRVLRLGRLGSWHLEAADPWDATVGLRPDRWARASTTWRSVTPIALPFHGGGRRLWADAARAVVRACAVAGYPRPAAVTVGPLSEVAGVPAARAFATRRKHSDAPRSAAHATVRFPVPVRGPVLLGPLRYFGLGLFLPDAIPERPSDGWVG